MEDLFVIALCCSIIFSHIVGKLSEKNGTTYLFGFILSIILSPLIGYIFIIIMKKSKNIPSIALKDCPFCFKKIDKLSIQCVHCNEVLVKDVDDIIKYKKEYRLRQPRYNRKIKYGVFSILFFLLFYLWNNGLFDNIKGFF